MILDQKGFVNRSSAHVHGPAVDIKGARPTLAPAMLLFVSGSHFCERDRGGSGSAVRAEHLNIKVGIIALEPRAFPICDRERRTRCTSVVVVRKVSPCSVIPDANREALKITDVALNILHACHVAPDSLLPTARPP
jgi:hypothetical protein